MSLVTEYPLWFLFFCLLLGGLYAYVLYYSDKKLEFSSTLNRILASLRFVLISFIAFLLLSPLFKSIVKEHEKPVIIVAVDNTLSILINKDSAYYATKFKDDFENFRNLISKKYEVKSFLFGEEINESDNISFNEKATNFSSLFREIRNRTFNRNIGAMVVVSDGLYNQGNNPVNISHDFRFPIYTVALGDTSLNRDLFFGKALFNKAAFLGNKFPVEVTVRANQLKNQRSVLTLRHKGKILFKRDIYINSDKYSESVKILIDASETGIQHYSLSLDELDGEISKVNNVRDIYIEILEGKEKVLIYADAPHPDLSALRQSLESSLSFEADIAYPGELKGKIEEYDIIILHQLPSGKNSVDNILNIANAKNIPVMYILGGNVLTPSFNNLKQGVQIVSSKNVYSEMQPSLSGEFSLFTINEETMKLIDEFPPLYGPFGDIKQQNSTDILFFQKINGVETNRPLFIFGQDLNKKFAIIAGEGLWKWRMANYNLTNNFDAFNEIIIKSLQYLSVKVNKSFFRLKYENNYSENEPVIFGAEVYNKSYELITDPEVEVTLQNEEGKSFPFSFTKSGNTYNLNAGIFPAGSYKFLAKTKVGNDIYQQAGSFSVSALNLETFTSSADHNLLFNLASQHNGKMVLPANLDELAKMINEREDIKTVTYSHKSYTELINIIWVMILLILMVSAEWFLRKRAGSY